MRLLDNPDVSGLAKCRVGVAADGGEGHREIGAALFEQQDVVSPRSPTIRHRRQLFDVQLDLGGRLGCCFSRIDLRPTADAARTGSSSQSPLLAESV